MSERFFDARLIAVWRLRGQPGTRSALFFAKADIVSTFFRRPPL
jgi:hypothetical protein